MICYKGFNQNLCCTMGRGTMQYEVGKTYTATRAQGTGPLVDKIW